jgi:hemerythrin superfamily protein
MKSVLTMTDKLKRDLPQMLEEHRAIVDALEKLADAARKEGKTEYVNFSRDLTLHAQTEEEVLYPAAILVGEYLKVKLHR